MIWYWLAVAYRRFKWLLSPAKARDVARISDESRCPVCGWAKNRLRAVYVKQGRGPNDTVPMCQHECERCGARVYEQTIVKLTTALVLPSVARNDDERTADRASILEKETGRRQEGQRLN